MQEGGERSSHIYVNIGSKGFPNFWSIFMQPDATSATGASRHEAIKANHSTLIGLEGDQAEKDAAAGLGAESVWGTAQTLFQNFGKGTGSISAKLLSYGLSLSCPPHL